MAFATDASLVPELPPPNAKAATAARPTTAAATTAQIQRGNEPRPPPLRVSTRFLGAWIVLGVRGARGVFAFFATRTGYGPNRRIAESPNRSARRRVLVRSLGEHVRAVGELDRHGREPVLGQAGRDLREKGADGASARVGKPGFEHEVRALVHLVVTQRACQALDCERSGRPHDDGR